jgi:trans-AT polyketide synthase/acyltransferase/oxidoreductase domain-containing protein
MSARSLTPDRLGSEEFRQDHGLRFAYVAGAMVKGIASPAMVIRMGQAGYLSFYGSGGMRLEAIEGAIRQIQAELCNGEPYGVNLLANPSQTDKEMAQVDLLLRFGVRTIEASAYMQVTAPLVKFRLAGLHTDGHNRLVVAHRIIAKISRPEVAALFLAPPPARIVQDLLRDGQISEEAARLSDRVPLASDLCVEADSGGHTDMGVMAVLLPAILRLRDEFQQRYRSTALVRVGAGGGIGSPEAAACAFLLGADFIATGSINQCTVEAATSATVKDLLQNLSVQDTAYAPAGDMFELGSKIQVMKKGVLFPAKASKLYDLWRHNGSLDSIDATMRTELQHKYFKRSFDEVYRETKNHYAAEFPAEIERAERNPKAMMALVFRWYFVHTMRLALEGDREQAVDYQVHTGPALGAFNQWVKGTRLEDWRNRHVEIVGTQLMEGCADYINRQLRVFA